MKYGFLIPYQCYSPRGGVRMQALMWKEGLEKLGHTVDMIGSWDTPDWATYDAFIVFDNAPGTRIHMMTLAKENPNVIFAPIIDPNVSKRKFKFYAKYWGAQKHLGLSSRFHDLWLVRELPKLWLARSEEEIDYINHCLEIPKERIAKVPLHYRIPSIDEVPEKEDFCFHASRLASWNKNVPRIIEAAKKYGFNLKLAGHLMGETEQRWLNDLIGAADNIEYVGEVSDEQLHNLYRRAKVFALPSLQEGVGMVALEAAAYGCEIVLTNLGAPKEYYDGRAILVDPTSVDEIGRGIVKALNEGHAQPELKSYMDNNYSERACMTKLNEAIIEAIK